MKTIGIDIGTTTISAVILDAVTGEVIDAQTINNDSFMVSSEPWEKIQDVKIISDKVKVLVDDLSNKYGTIDCVGLTGQMHGILYLDQKGHAISPLYTWQDGRGNLEFRNGKSYAQVISEESGYKVASGYGVVTHFYNVNNGIIPENTTSFCTIHDYIAMQLIGANQPMIDHTNAASLGLFDSVKGCFDQEAIENIGLAIELFPEIVEGAKRLGKTNKDMEVVVAIGDNQASFIGSVKSMEDSLLINIGTGSQISVMTHSYNEYRDMETRPSVEGNYLNVGSSLCGGRAYALLESFFQIIVSKVTETTKEQIYDIMAEMAKEAELLDQKLSISTTFSGTRQDPLIRGGVMGLSVDNFTPQHFTIGVLEGIVNELFDMYSELEKVGHKKPIQLIGSGNGLRKNMTLQKLFEKKFGMPLYIPLHQEEAAYGAALFALVGIKYFDTMASAQALIKYK